MDTTGWAESWSTLSSRILEGFEAIAKEVEAAGGGNAIVVSHGMTITTFDLSHRSESCRRIGLGQRKCNGFGL